MQHLISYAKALSVVALAWTTRERKERKAALAHKQATELRQRMCEFERAVRDSRDANMFVESQSLYIKFDIGGAQEALGVGQDLISKIQKEWGEDVTSLCKSISNVLPSIPP